MLAQGVRGAGARPGIPGRSGARAKIEFGFVPGEEIDKVVAQIAATPPDIAERYAKAFGPPSP